MLRFCLLLGLSLLLGPSLTAQYDYARRDRDTPRQADWLRRYDQGNRFEGNYTQEVSSGAVELVSFVGSMTRYEFGQGQALYLYFYQPKKGDYLLKLEELRSTQFYWGEWKNTQAEQDWERCGPWPVDEGLERYRVSPRNLAILVRLGSTSQPRYAPVFVSLDTDRLASRYYLLRFRLGRSIIKGNYRLYPGERPGGKPLLEQELA
jgi:hypothetical protein